MKIRANYVSNSSSSSFIIAGKDIKKTLEANINDTTVCPHVEYYDDIPGMTYGDVNKNILGQINKSTEERVKNLIYYLIYKVVEDFREFTFYRIIPNKKCNSFDWNFTPESEYYNKYDKGGKFDITEEMADYIKNGMKKYYKKTKKTNEMDYWDINEYCPKIDEMIKNLADKIFNDFKAKYPEMYAVSYGDNHGECTGQMGCFVESEYLGHNTISGILNVNWDVFVNSEH